ncbi:phosphopantetheine-binding protein [Mycoplasmopsis columbina]|uniref:phosphopantetheine-binding protein n=1 Tax=Mycoplasmopsis columbina TaxID=114881 RepID=UPI0004A783CF|nr:phosphopantetheine-binding protein [Mycoplasmopsis columbina]VEU77173.1 acyl carrier protein [Mycoplasmopsis columbina]
MENKILEKIQRKTSQKVLLSSNLKELKIDSLDLAELIFEAEQELNVQFDDNELLKLATVQDIIDLINKTLKK